MQWWERVRWWQVGRGFVGVCGARLDSAGGVGWAECDGCRGVESRVRGVAKDFWVVGLGGKEGVKGAVSFVWGLGEDGGMG